MSQSYAYREKRNAIAAWLRDRFADGDDVPDAAFWRDATDLIKFLTGNGFRIESCAPDLNRIDTVSDSYT